MTLTLQPWMLVPAASTLFWFLVLAIARDRDMIGFLIVSWIGSVVPAVLVGLLK